MIQLTVMISNAECHYKYRNYKTCSHHQTIGDNEVVWSVLLSDLNIDDSHITLSLFMRHSSH